MNREEALILLKKYMKNKNLLKHSYAAEAAMKGLYQYLTPKNEHNETDENVWGISGLLHDIDYEKAQETNQLDKHGRLLFDTGEVKLPERIEHAIQAHNFTNTKIDPESKLDWAITTCDQLTGLIVACALVQPDKKLDVLTPDSVLKKFNMSAFARGADREMIKLCESKLNIPLIDFIDIVLQSMKTIHNDLEL